jgi:hypothetical protein
MRTQQIIGTAALTSGQSVTFPFTALQVKTAGRPTNLVGVSVRLAKTVASIVRPATAAITIRDAKEPQFDSTGLELAAQMRERGEAPTLQLGAASATDTFFAIFRPGYGLKPEDFAHAAGLFQSGGSITIALPVDAGQTTNVEVTAYLDTNGGLRIAPRAITRQLAATTREIPGDYLLARLRDAGFVAANVYSVRTSERELLTGITGLTLQQAYEASLGPAGDPVVLTAVAQTAISAPNFVRSILADYSYGSGEKQPPISYLPNSNGNVSALAGFAGAPIVTYLYPRSLAEARELAAAACQAAGVPLGEPVPPGTNAEMFQYLPYTVRAVGR